MDADLGCFNSEVGITAFVPKAKSPVVTAAGHFGRDDFIYDAVCNQTAVRPETT